MTAKQRAALNAAVKKVERQVGHAVSINNVEALTYGSLTHLEAVLLNTINACSDALQPLRKEIQKRDRRRGNDRRKARRS